MYLFHLSVKTHVRRQTRWFARLLLREFPDMPMKRHYIPELQEMRREQKDRRIEKSDGPAYLQFIGSGANGAPRSLYFFTDYNRYIFNVGEGSQRLAHEHKIKISRLEHVFVTQAVWENIGGLLGFALTLQECGVPMVTLHGPDGLNKTYEAANRFVFLNNLKIHMADCYRGGCYNDPMVTITYVPLKPVNKVDEKDSVEKSESAAKDTDFHLPEREDPALLSRPEGTDLISVRVMSYICRMNLKLGKLNLELCVEKNVPPGPLLGKLKAGLDITLSDGTLVKAADVKDPDEPGAVFIVVDCPSEDYLDSLASETLFRSHQIGGKSVDLPKYVIHYTPSSVINNERYQRWMKRFAESTLHVNANDCNKCLGCIGAHEIQSRLNLIDSKIFPLLKDDSIRSVNTSCLTKEQIYEALFDKTSISGANYAETIAASKVRRKHFDFADHEANTLRCLPLRDTHTIDVPDCVFLDTARLRKQITSRAEFHEALKKCQSKLDLVQPYHPDREYPRVTFLGTGSCIPNKCRNVSCILVSLAHDNHMILDCGEGSYGQFVRHFGLARATEILSRTNVIFVSHVHADHHLGFINLLKFRNRAIKNVEDAVEKLIVVGPKTMHFWLKNYDHLFEKLFHSMEFIEAQHLEYRSKDNSCVERVKTVAPLSNMTTAYVTHCPYAFGVAFEHTNGTKITYSGDTMPAKTLLQIGANSNLLIHEATFEDDLIREARAKLHSTFSEAIEMGLKMNADYTILTHFSQRYAKVPVFNNNFDERVGVAFDNMEVCLNDLPKLHHFNPLLEFIFEEELEELELRASKRRKVALLDDHESSLM